MRGYSKMRMRTNLKPTSKPRTMDFPDFFIPSPPNLHEDPKLTSMNPKKKLEEEEEADNGGGAGGRGGERFGVVLRRNSSSNSQRFRAPSEKGTTTVQGIVRRAFSMRRPSSFGDGYWRIHDTCEEAVVPEEEEEEQQQEVKKSSSVRKGGKFYRAWKKIFKF